MSSGLENLTQHIFSHSGVESSHIERSLIRFGRGATRNVAWPHRCQATWRPIEGCQAEASPWRSGWDSCSAGSRQAQAAAGACAAGVRLGGHRNQGRRRGEGEDYPQTVAGPPFCQDGSRVARGANGQVIGVLEKIEFGDPMGDEERRRRQGHANG
jgi:hypothetical protein